MDFSELNFEPSSQANASENFSLAVETLAKLKAQINQGSYRVKGNEVATKIIEQLQMQLNWKQRDRIKNLK